MENNVSLIDATISTSLGDLGSSVAYVFQCNSQNILPQKQKQLFIKP